MKRIIKRCEEYMLNRRFGRLVVLERRSDRYKPSGEPYDMWLCRCDCGAIKEVAGPPMRDGRTMSCGCLKKCFIPRKHGQSYTRLHRIWSGMKGRCRNKNNPEYARYGGRGIIVCDEWENSFESFYKWAMNSGYKETLSIDRIDNNGNYCPENCRWATPKEQANNTRNTKLITHNGETHTVAEWAEIKGIREKTLRERIYKRHWPIEKALEQKVRNYTYAKSN